MGFDTDDDIDEIMDFTPEYLSRYEEQVKNDKKALREKETVIETGGLRLPATGCKVEVHQAVIVLQRRVGSGQDSAFKEIGVGVAEVPF